LADICDRSLRFEVRHQAIDLFDVATLFLSQGLEHLRNIVMAQTAH
jgi:hypothetical protein